MFDSVAFISRTRFCYEQFITIEHELIGGVADGMCVHLKSCIHRRAHKIMNTFFAMKDQPPMPSHIGVIVYHCRASASQCAVGGNFDAIDREGIVGITEMALSEALGVELICRGQHHIDSNGQRSLFE